MITTNAPFKQWDTVFPNATCDVALLPAPLRNTRMPVATIFENLEAGRKQDE